MGILGWIKNKDNSKSIMDNVDKCLQYSEQNAEECLGIPDNLQKDLAVMGIPVWDFGHTILAGENSK